MCIFSYVKEKPLIEDLNLSVKPGQRIAIVGPTGCGKTTLINLLMRFYDVDEGSIRMDAKDIRHLTRKSLRSAYGMVLQDTWLKSGTIRENILMGKPDATEERDDPGGKRSPCGQLYPQASGRVRYGDSGRRRKPVPGAEAAAVHQQGHALSASGADPGRGYLFDRHTRTEIRIQKAFQRMMEGRTSFVVAHRLPTIRESDVILVMKDGHIIEQGNHEELLRKNGFSTRSSTTARICRILKRAVSEKSCTFRNGRVK